MATRLIPVPLPMTTAPGRGGYIGGQRLVNCFAKKRVTRGGKPGVQIWAVAGLASFATLSGASTVRGMIEMDGTGYVVGGPLLYSVSQSGVVTTIGPVPGTGQVHMDRNRRTPNPELVIISDGLRYLYSNGAVAAMSDPDLPSPNGVVVIDGYAIYTISDGRLFASQIDEAGNIDPLAVAREDTSPDANVGIARRGRDVAVFGAQVDNITDQRRPGLTGGGRRADGRVYARPVGGGLADPAGDWRDLAAGIGNGGGAIDPEEVNALARVITSEAGQGALAELRRRRDDLVQDQTKT